MQYTDMSEVDLKLALLSGSPIELGGLTVVPYTMREINAYGYTRYTRNLQWLSLSVDDFIHSIKGETEKTVLADERDSLKAFDFYIKLGGPELQDALLNTLSMLFRTDDVFVLDNVGVLIGLYELGILEKTEDGTPKLNEELSATLSHDDVKLIDRTNFDDLVEIVKLQNYLEKPKNLEDDEDDAADEYTRKLMAHMKQMHKKVEETKKRQSGDDGEAVDIADIISSVSSKSNNLNKFTIWDLTLYQIYDEYTRLQLIDGYDISIRAMMAGAEMADGIKHWSSKID